MIAPSIHCCEAIRLDPIAQSLQIDSCPNRPASLEPPYNSPASSPNRQIQAKRTIPQYRPD
ncbi:hypothetical protein GCM10023156_13920 [Novipirellula rosea]|uniref:Uncharacterized protein n=1 Tax=Novipirellula rosea TaxID=1031540 RepID=A0ABP8MH82_9BACT